MVYTDGKNLISDASYKELSFFAKMIGCPISSRICGVIIRYRLTKDQFDTAIIYGCRYVNHKELLRLAYHKSPCKLFFWNRGKNKYETVYENFQNIESSSNLRINK